jgi:phosphopantothenoylcysteine decarboxylase/phosphopantothenate--cysteine ligase
MISTGKRIILAVTGSIAAYKAVELLRLLTRAGHEVRVVQTPSSRKFIGALSFQALSGHPVACDQFDTGADSVFNHIELAAGDLMLVAPATADTIGKMAAGIADNLLLSTYLATIAPVVVCPAMNHRMWDHTAVQENIDTLRRRGVLVVEPGSGELACGEEGAGRMAEPGEIVARIEALLAGGTTDLFSQFDLKGVRVLVTAGGTREPIDAVRYITNRSSGRMGFALAEAAFERGAEVTVIAANCAAERKAGIRYVDVMTAAELETAVESEFENCDVLLMAAAVSDYKVSAAEPMGKLENKGKTDLQLVPIGDIVSHLQGNGSGRLKVGFSAEYGEDKRERARGKLREKGLSMMVFNDISRADIGFESTQNEITIMMPGRNDIFVEKTSKRDCAERILDQVVELLK